ncbi:MAG: aminotransferase class I/II-fold pyridoxal phosphate-dependent enzyme, partial [Miltoncostaeaceae bacterium]
KMNLGKQAADLCSGTVTQRFIIEYLRRFDWRDHVARLNDIYRGRRDAMLRALEEEFPADAHWTQPSGGLFVWAELPQAVNTRDLLAQAIAREVAFVPGAAAFLDGQGQNAMRLNFSGVPEATISEGVRRLGETVHDAVELHRALGLGSASE